MQRSIAPKKFIHLFAVGYPDGLYGDQDFHQKKSKIDPQSIQKTIEDMTYEK
jgi:transketolase